MATKSLPPSISALAFDCPHCGAYTTQQWYHLHASERRRDLGAPGFPTGDALHRIQSNPDTTPEQKKDLTAYFEKLLSGLVFFHESSEIWSKTRVQNLHLTECFSCGQISVWVHDGVLFPACSEGPPPNPDLPENVRVDYQEASTILKLSPRGSAALLRLAIQKLCVELGEKGKKIDDDIGSLVRKGLSPLVQQALDAVRVIGNEAVHPGTLDLRDDSDTAGRLFDLVNIITEQMISNPKHVKELYDKLPESKRKAIEERDAKAKGSSQ